jgi:hypothetical protein
MVERNWAAAKENQSERQGRESQWKLRAAVARQSIVNVHFHDGDSHIDADCESGGAGEKTDQNQQASKELSKGRQICAPAGQAQTLHKLNMVMKSAENLVVTMDHENHAQGEAHHEQGERLETIKVAQVFPPSEKQASLQHGATQKEVPRLAT